MVQLFFVLIFLCPKDEVLVGRSLMMLEMLMMLCMSWMAKSCLEIGDVLSVVVVLLDFAWDVAKVKCILMTTVCLS